MLSAPASFTESAGRGSSANSPIRATIRSCASRGSRRSSRERTARIRLGSASLIRRGDGVFAAELFQFSTRLQSVQAGSACLQTCGPCESLSGPVRFRRALATPRRPSTRAPQPACRAVQEYALAGVGGAIQRIGQVIPLLGNANVHKVRSGYGVAGQLSIMYIIAVIANLVNAAPNRAETECNSPGKPGG